MEFMQVLEPATSSEFEKYYELRWQVLRGPWNQARGSERAPDDATAYHAMLVNAKKEVIGVCRMHLETTHEAQIRFMAIHSDYQGKGLGKKILNYLEEKAKHLGAIYMILQARENALAFYERCGYDISEKTHLLFGEIQHYKMRKDL